MKKGKILFFLMAFLLALVIIDFTILNEEEPANVPTNETNSLKTHDIEFVVDGNTAVIEYEEEKKVEIKQITSSEFEEEVLKSDQTVIVDFYADWCGPCKKMEPILQNLAAEKTDVKFLRLNIDNPEDSGSSKMAEQYGASLIPFLVKFEDGKVVDTSIGLKDKGKLIEFIGK